MRQRLKQLRDATKRWWRRRKRKRRERRKERARLKRDREIAELEIQVADLEDQLDDEQMKVEKLWGVISHLEWITNYQDAMVRSRIHQLGELAEENRAEPAE